MDNYDFGDGGAFPEIHHVQYPLGVGRSGADGLSSSTAGGESSAPTAAQGGSSGLNQQTPAAAVVGEATTSHALVLAQQRGLTVIGAERKKPDEATLVENDAKTAAQLALVIAEKTGASSGSTSVNRPSVVTYTPQLGVARTIQISEKTADPLDPTRHRAKKVRREAVGDPAPIVRSPPRDDGPTGGGGGTKLTGFSNLVSDDAKGSSSVNIGPAVSNWKNPRNLAIPIEQRKKQQTTTTAKVGQAHFALAAALREAADDVKEEKEAVERDRALAAEEAQKEQEEKANLLAKEALSKQVAASKEERLRRQDETPEQRQARIEAERDERDRRREEERKLRTNEATARRLGVSLEEVEQHQQDVEVFESDDRAGATTGAGKAAEAGSSGDLYDSALFHKKKQIIGGRLNHDNIAKEAERLAKSDKQQAADDDDVFGVGDALATRKRGRQ